MQNMQFRNLGNRFLWRVRNSGNHEVGHIDAHGLFLCKEKQPPLLDGCSFLSFSLYSFLPSKTCKYGLYWHILVYGGHTMGSMAPLMRSWTKSPLCQFPSALSPSSIPIWNVSLSWDLAASFVSWKTLHQRLSGTPGDRTVTMI